MFKRILIVLAAAMFGQVGPAHAGASPTKPLDLFDLGAPSFVTFSTRDGLPDSVTVTVRTDARGFVWVGTQHGLAWYDGRRWHKLDNPRLRGYVDQLYLDHDGRLWACSRAFGLARYDGRHWHVVGREQGLTRVRRLYETPDAQGGHRLWAVTWNAGLFYRQDGRWTPDPGNHELPSGPLYAMAQTGKLFGQTRQWVGTSRGLWYRRPGGPWQRFREADFDPASVEALHVSHHGSREVLWISVFGDGVWRLRADGVRNWSRESGELPSDEVYNIAESTAPHGGHAIWVASRAGLVRIYKGRARVFGRRYGLPSNAVRGLRLWRSPNGEQVLWLATEAGLARTVVNGSPWRTVSLLGAKQSGIFGEQIRPDRQGAPQLWVGSAGAGVGVYEKGRWRYLTKASGSLPTDFVNLLKATHAARGEPVIWVATARGQVLRSTRGTALEQVDVPWKHSPGQTVRDVIGRRIDGVVEYWFSTRLSGIFRLRRGTWTSFRPAGAPPTWGARDLLAQVTRDGRSWLWATSAHGLLRFDGRHWMQLGPAQGLPDADMLGLGLLPDAHGRDILWIGTVHHGIVRVDVSDPLHPMALPSDLPPPPDPMAYDALRGRDGSIYICTNAGVQVLKPSGNGYRSRVFTRRDGMVNDECNLNAQMMDAQGRYWAGTLGGLSVYDPSQEKKDRIPKPLRLISVTIDGRPVETRTVHESPGHHDLRVRYALLSWRHEDASRFRTDLKGFDTKPGSWTAENQRDIGVLPPGEYTLVVEARDYAGNLSKPLRIPIVVEGYWWEADWARALLALALVLLAYAVLRWRMFRLQRRQRDLEKQVAARTEQLHEANRRLLGLSQRDPLTGLYNRRHLFERLQPDAVRHHERVAFILIDVDRFKKHNDSYGHQAGDEALRVVAGEIRRRAPADTVIARYGGEEFACLLFDHGLEDACAIAENIRAGVASSPVPTPSGGTCEITISAGVSSRVLEHPGDIEAMVHEADQALYAAKRAGRNCVCGPQSA